MKDCFKQILEKNSRTTYMLNDTAEECNNVAKLHLNIILDSIRTIPTLENGNISTLAIDSFVHSIRHAMKLD
jgi:hypothetical protein